MNPIKLVAVFILSLVLMACGSSLGTETLVVTPPASALTMSFTPTKAFRFTWPAARGATYYNLKEAATVGSGYTLVKKTTATSFDHVVPLYARLNAKYILESCSDTACSTSTAIFTSTKLAAMSSSIGYMKASNPGSNDSFGEHVSLSSDGNTLAVGANGEDSNSTTINNVGSDGGVNNNTGAVYVFTRSGTTWTQQAYLKPDNTGAGDEFGGSVSLSSDGNTLAVGAVGEDSSSTLVNSTENNSAPGAGAVYVFTRSGTAWTQQAYVKASNTGAGDEFGLKVSLSSDGNTLATGAGKEGSDRQEIFSAVQLTYGTDSAAGNDSGAVYVFTRSGTTWTQQAYVKASNLSSGDFFGEQITLSPDGNTLAVGGQDDSDLQAISSAAQLTYGVTNGRANSGAVYIFTRTGTTWTQQAFIKASNAGASDFFGASALALSSDGNTLAVGTKFEDSDSQAISSAVAFTYGTDSGAADDSGAVYVFTRSGTTWTQQAYVKASNAGADDQFGESVSLSSDGNTLAVSAQYEDGDSKGVVNDVGTDTGANQSGAVYVFTRTGSTWTPQAYMKASNAKASGGYNALALSADGNTLAVGGVGDDSGSSADQTDTSVVDSGAVYLY